MSQDQQSSASAPDQFAQQQPAKAGGGTWKACLIGCFAVFLVILVVCGGLGYYLYSNAKNIAIDFAQNVAVEVVRESDLSDEDKDAVIAQIDRVADEYKAGNIDTEQVVKIMEKLVESPLLSLGIIYFIEQQYVNPSELSEEEKMRLD